MVLYQHIKRKKGDGEKERERKREEREIRISLLHLSCHILSFFVSPSLVLFPLLLGHIRAASRRCRRRRRHRRRRRRPREIQGRGRKTLILPTYKPLLRAYIHTLVIAEGKRERKRDEREGEREREEKSPKRRRNSIFPKLGIRYNRERALAFPSIFTLGS